MQIKMMDTLTLSTHRSLLYFLHKSCTVATPKHFEPFLLENYVCIVALTLDLQRVSFYSVTEFLHHSSTMELLLSMILIKGYYPSFQGPTTMREIVISLVAVVACKFLYGHANESLESEQLTIFG